MKNKVLGIDLGTTYSCVSYIDDNDKPVILKNSDGNLTTPSVVFFEDDNIIVGESAKESSKIYPDQVVSYIKKDMGKTNSSQMINGKKLSPEEISSYTLKKIVKDANDTLHMERLLPDNEEIKNVVITCPAYFGINERNSTKIAGELAGLNVLQIINEPTAAAINYGMIDNVSEKTVLVYDLGGGTFDITMINIKPNEIKVICTGGDHNLGGKEWDEKILLYIDDEFKKQTNYNKSPLEDPEMIQELRLSVEKAKKLLTAKDKAPISVNFEGKRAKIELMRSKFDELTQDLLIRTIEMTKDMLKEAEKKGYKQSDIDDFILVGGSTRMPQVTKAILDNFGITPKMFDPDEAVAKGAAMFAVHQDKYNSILKDISNESGLSPEQVKDKLDKGEKINGMSDKSFRLLSSDSMKITNVSSRSFGILALNSNNEKKLFNLVLKNNELPAKREQSFFTVSENQKDVLISIQENIASEKEIEVSLGSEIGKAILELPPNSIKGSEIVVEFNLNESGLLEMKATEKNSNKIIEIKIETKNQLTDDEMSSAIKRVEETNLE